MNKVKKYIILTVIILVAYIGVRSVISDIQRKNYKLNDRQIAILEEMDMTTDWEELTNYQQDCIMSIEKMLEYLEKKYDKEFCYGGYIAENGLYNDKEELLAYAKGDNRETDCFGVRPTKFGYEDDYAYIYLLPEYEEKYNEQIKEIVGESKFFNYTVIEEVKGQKVIRTSSRMALSYSENYKELGEEIYKTLRKNDEFADNFIIYVLDEKYIEQMTRENWEDILDVDCLIDMYDCMELSSGISAYWESEE